MSHRVICVLVLVILCLVMPPITAAAPPITWSPTSLERHLTSGLSFAETIVRGICLTQVTTMGSVQAWWRNTRET